MLDSVEIETTLARAAAALSNGSASAVQSVIKDVQATAAALQRETEALDAGRATALLQSDGAVEEHDRRRAVLTRLSERVAATLEALAGRAAAVTAEEREAARRAAYDRAKELLARAPDVADRYRQAVDLIRGVLRQLGEATAAVDAANADLPAGAEPLPSAEAWRFWPARPEEIVEDSIVEVWARAGGPLPPEQQGLVVDCGNGKGKLPRPDGEPEEVNRAAFRKQRYRQYAAALTLEPLSMAVRLPPLNMGEPEGWFGADPDLVLAELDRLSARSVHERPERPVLERFVRVRSTTALADSPKRGPAPLESYPVQKATELTPGFPRFGREVAGMAATVLHGS